MRLFIFFVVILTVTVSASVLNAQSLMDVQQELHARGYSLGPADGIMGQRTRAAIIKFQKDSQLTVTGKVDSETKNALFEKTPTALQDQTPKVPAERKGISISSRIIGTPTESEIVSAIEEDVRANALTGQTFDDAWTIVVDLDDVRQIADESRILLFRGLSEDENTLFVYAATSMYSISHSTHLTLGFIDHFILRRDETDRWKSEIVRNNE